MAGRRLAFALVVMVITTGTACGNGREEARRWPGPSDTGVPEGTRLAAVEGDQTFALAGAVVEDRDIRGCVTVTAPGVTLRRVRVRDCPRDPVVDVGYGLQGILLEDCEIDGGRLNPTASGVGYEGFTVRRCEIHGTGNGVHMSADVVVEDSWVHDLVEGEATHNDAVITNGGSRFVVRRNTLENRHTQTAVIALFGDHQPVVDVVVEGNLLAGGGYTIYGGSVAGKPHSEGAASIRVTGNHFQRTFFPDGGRYGPVHGFDPARPGNVWAGNVWHDTGAPVTP